jgi:hypothetical protein
VRTCRVGWVGAMTAATSRTELAPVNSKMEMSPAAQVRESAPLSARVELCVSTRALTHFTITRPADQPWMAVTASVPVTL